MAETKDMHKYTGMQKFTDTEGGYSLWIPAGWKHLKLGNRGTVHFFTPYPDRDDTGFTAEKRQLEFKVKSDDLPVLKEGFVSGINLLSNVEIEMVSDTITDEMLGVEAKFSFKEEGQTRKRWTRVIYSGTSLLILTAQGATPEEYDQFLPMFFNIMMSTNFV